jgi:NAD(P)-dependent dehydrogenase (short-subunit alcohol dehydrogenase family)
MSGIDAFRYDGKRVLVVGGASGMGAAAAKTVVELGGEVIVLDYAPVDFNVKESIQVDLRDRAAIDTALDQVGGPIHAIFSAAGVADGTPGLLKINFIGHRHIIERLVESDVVGRGGAICMISSAAGLGWESEAQDVGALLATPDFESASAWAEANAARDNYMFSKQVMNTYVARQAYPFIAKGVRINAICPGPTDTPLARANADLWLGFGQDWREATGTSFGTPEEMGDTMAFLNSDAARGISGVTLIIDSGYMMSSLAGSYGPGQGVAQFLFGRL